MLHVGSRVARWSSGQRAGLPASSFKSQPGQKFGSRFLFHLRPLANSAMMSKLTTHCQWEDEMVRERTDHLPSYAEDKKMKSLTLHTHGCPRQSLRV